MDRSWSLGWLALAASTWSMIGCGGASVRTEPAAGSEPACAVGAYAGTGLDEGGVTWEFTLALREAGPDLVGDFHWVGSDGSVGDEQIRGHVDCASRTFEWRGETASGGSETMDIVTAHYTGTFDEGFRSFSGRWGGAGTPGTLTGQRR
jgi:hypothetical protein